MGSVKDANVPNILGSGSKCKPLSKRKRCVHHLIGKVLHCPRNRDHEIAEAKKDAIKDIKKAWKQDSIDAREYIIKEIDEDGTLRFSFEDPSDKQWVMDGRPWLLGFEGHLLMLDEWDTPDINMLQYCPFWVQAHGIPDKLMSKELAYDIGKVFGADQPFEVDTNENAKADFLRFRVMVNVKKRVISGCWLALPKNDVNDEDDKLLWVSFTYEQLPYMCFLCGVIGHHTNRCNLIYPKLEETDEEKQNTIIINGDGNENEKPVVCEGQIVRDMSIRGYAGWLQDQSLFEEGARYYDLDDPSLCTRKGWRSEGRIVVPNYTSETDGYELSDDDDVISVVLQPKP